MKKLLTLCLVEKDNQILLGMKKRGFGEGHYNGFGGKVEADETIEAGAARELLEEVGLTAHQLEKVGVLEFTFESDPALELQMHIFKTQEFEGTPLESDEMSPQWFTINSIPYDRMWTSDVKWFSLFLSGQKFTGAFHFDEPASATHTAVILRELLSPVEGF